MTKSFRSNNESQKPSRREFLGWSGKVAAGSALAAAVIPKVHAAENNTLQLALIGCGGRGSGAVGNAMNAPGGPVKLVAMADVFENRLKASHKALSKQFADRMDVPEDRQFVGFDAYRKAIDCLKPGDIALITSYTAFRPVHLDYAVEKGVHVFMEKPFAADPVGVKRIIKAGEAAKKKNLKIASGLMCRHSQARQELIKKIRDGEMGEIQLVRAYRTGGSGRVGPRKPDENELLWQIRRRTAFLWISGGLFSELSIHHIDEICWIKDAWPVAAHGLGGRVFNNKSVGQIFDTYSIEYTFPDGTKALAVGRYVPNTFYDFATYIHGTKCGAQFSGNIHAPTVHMYKDQRMEKDNIVWKAGKEPCGPHQAEWNVLLDAIRNDKPHNEAERAAMANLAEIMGRASVHTGQIITLDDALASNFQFYDKIDDLTFDTPAPVQADASGQYPVPIPGQSKEI